MAAERNPKLRSKEVELLPCSRAATRGDTSKLDEIDRAQQDVRKTLIVGEAHHPIPLFLHHRSLEDLARRRDTRATPARAHDGERAEVSFRARRPSRGASRPPPPLPGGVDVPRALR